MNSELGSLEYDHPFPAVEFLPAQFLKVVETIWIVSWQKHLFGWRTYAETLAGSRKSPLGQAVPELRGKFKDWDRDVLFSDVYNVTHYEQLFSRTWIDEARVRRCDHIWQ